MSDTIDIIITTRNNAQMLRNVLRSVAEQTFPNYQCYVIDDCSADETSAMVAKEFAWVKFLSSKDRRGPSHNRNIAAVKGNAQFIVTLDDDVVLEPNWLEEMVKFISSSASIGAVSSQLRSGHSKDVIMGLGGFFAANGMGGDICFNTPIDAVKSLVERPMRVVFACSAAMIMRREAFEKAGGFDSRYFYLSEDYDLGLRINYLGFLVEYNPKAVAYHYYHKVASKNFSAAKLDYFYYRNGLCTVLKNFSVITILCMMPYFFFGAPSKFFILAKAAAWNLLHIGGTIKIRRNVNKYRKIPDSQILVLNSFLRSTYKYDILPQSKGLLVKKRLEKLPFMVSPLVRLFYEEVLTKSRHVDNIIFYITNVCNARCKHCFLYNILNKDVEKNLSLDEIEKFFSSLGRVKNIVLGGGEPFLRQDLVQLCIALEKTSHPRAFTIPTNGLASDIIFEKVKGILENTQTRLVIPISIDGPSSIHEEIRGVPGLFEKTQQTYKNLLLLYYMFYPRITLQVNATISSHNYKYFEETYQIVRKYFSKARFTFEVIRGHYDSSVAGGITDEMYNDLISLVQGLNDPALKNLIQLHKLALKTIKKKKQIVTCNAGNNFIVLDHLGNLAPCEILPPFANIRDIKYDFLSIKNDARWQKVIQDIRNGKCHCTHMCFLGSSQHDNGNKIKNFFKK